MGVDFLAIGVGDKAGVGFGHSGKIGQTSGAVVAGAGIDFGEMNSHNTKIREYFDMLGCCEGSIFGDRRRTPGRLSKSKRRKE